jgi:hypothetical protein
MAGIAELPQQLLDVADCSNLNDYADDAPDLDANIGLHFQDLGFRDCAADNQTYGERFGLLLYYLAVVSGLHCCGCTGTADLRQSSASSDTVRKLGFSERFISQNNVRLWWCAAGLCGLRLGFVRHLYPISTGLHQSAFGNDVH